MVCEWEPPDRVYSALTGRRGTTDHKTEAAFAWSAVRGERRILMGSVLRSTPFLATEADKMWHCGRLVSLRCEYSPCAKEA